MSRKVITAAELDTMTPAEREQTFRDSIVQDLNQVPPALLARIRTKVEARLVAQDAADFPDRAP